MWQAGAIFQGEWENFHVGMYVTAYSYTKNTIVLGWGEFCFVLFYNWKVKKHKAIAGKIGGLNSLQKNEFLV